MKGYFSKRGDTWSYRLDLGKDLYGRRRQKTKNGFQSKQAAQSACAELISQIQKMPKLEP